MKKIQKATQSRGSESQARKGTTQRLQLAATERPDRPFGLLQAKGGADGTDIHRAAEAGVQGSGGSLPFLDTIQRSFGAHDVSDVQSYTGGAAVQANAQIGAQAYATGNKVAFGGAPTLHTAAHEAAHVVQQRGGVSLTDGVGAEGDRYETHADAAADLVVQGRSAEGLLNKMAGSSGSLQKKASNIQVMPVQEKPVQQAPVQRVAPVVLLGMTAGELAGVVSAVTGVAVAVGAATAPQNDKTGKGPMLKLNFDKDYLMGPASKSFLEQIARTLYFQECERLTAGGRPQDEIKETAQGNVRAQIVSVLESQARVWTYEAIENGAGGHSKSVPWGSATARMHSGAANYDGFGSGLAATARTHGVTLPNSVLTYVKSCTITYDFEKNASILGDDDIYVRGQSIQWRESATAALQILADVAFDFDGDTVYDSWDDSTPMSPNAPTSVPIPTRRGPSNPDD